MTRVAVTLREAAGPQLGGSGLAAAVHPLAVSSPADRGPTPFASDAEAAAIGEGLIACTLPRPSWTHAAHLAAAVYVLTRRRELDPVEELPRLIRAYNAVIGAAEDGLRGYHETITQFHIQAVRHFLSRVAPDRGLAEICNLLVASPFGRRDFALSFYSPGRLFSLEAKRRFIEPDLRPLAFDAVPLEAPPPAVTDPASGA
jgi:hypothetical protein